MEKKNYLKVILRVILIFVIFEVVINTLGSQLAGIFYKTIVNGKYIPYLISEIVVLLFAIILVIIRKRTYIFKEKKLSFKNTLDICLPILILACLSFVTNLSSIVNSVNIPNIISLVIYAAAIGLFEEIFFRGIILEEMLKSSDSKKAVILSIILSGIIFGSLHFTNIFYGQDLITTIMQLIQSSAIGILFAVVYVLSKNIFALAFLHGFYDFAVLLNETSLTTSCSYIDSTPLSVTLSSFIASLILSLIYIVYSVKVFKSDNKKRYGIIIYVLIGLLILSNVLFNTFGADSSKYYVCTKYEDVSIKSYDAHFYSYNDFYYDDIHVYKMGSKAYVNDKELDIENVKRVILVNDKVIVLASKNSNSYIYVGSVFENDFSQFNVPSVSGLGYLKDVDENVVYPMFKTSTNDLYIITSNTINQVIGG